MTCCSAERATTSSWAAKAEGDHILLSKTLAADFAAVLSHAAMVGADTVITLGAEVIVLSGVSMSGLAASDFLFA